MIVCDLALLALAVQAPAPAVDVAWPDGGSLAVTCPAGRTTRIVFPDPLRRLKTFGSDRQAMAIAVERTTPNAVVVLRPVRHPAQCGLEFHGTTLTLRVELSTTESGEDTELRLAAPAPRAIEPASATPMAATPLPPPSAASPSATAEPATASTSPEEGDAVDQSSQQLPWAQAVPIGRREGLPGQPVLVLEDALRTEDWIWYRLRLEGGAREQIASLEWERGSLDYQQVSVAADRRIIVRVPRKLVSRRTRLVLRLASGAVYRVAPFPPTVSGLFRRLFR